MKVAVTSPSVKVDAKDKVRWMRLEAQTEREQIQLADLAKALEALGQYQADDEHHPSLAAVLCEVEEIRAREEEAFGQLGEGCQFDGTNDP